MQRQQFIGNLTRDCELRVVNTKDGEKKVANISIAVNDDYNPDKDPLYLEFEAWDKLAENCSKCLKKGSLVFVETTMRNNNYEKEDGTKVYGYRFAADYVKFLTPKNEKDL